MDQKQSSYIYDSGGNTSAQTGHSQWFSVTLVPAALDCAAGTCCEFLCLCHNYEELHRTHNTGNSRVSLCVRLLVSWSSKVWLLGRRRDARPAVKAVLNVENKRGVITGRQAPWCICLDLHEPVWLHKAGPDPFPVISQCSFHTEYLNLRSCFAPSLGQKRPESQISYNIVKNRTAQTFSFPKDFFFFFF